jgi:hypothetical protein
MADDVMAQFEAEFPHLQNPDQSEAPRMCRECKTRPRTRRCDADCEDVLGDCCYCGECGARRMNLLVAGILGAKYERSSPGPVTPE